VAWDPSLLEDANEDVYFPATIVAANSDGTYRVEYEDDDIEDVDKSLDTTRVTTKVEPQLLFTIATGVVPGAGVCDALPTGLTAAMTTHVLASSMYRLAPALLDGVKLQTEYQNFVEFIVSDPRFKVLLTHTKLRPFAHSILSDSTFWHWYPNVCELLAIMLTIPASSAESERTFSCQNIIKTKDRTNLDVKFLDCLVRIYRLSRIHYFRDYVATLQEDSTAYKKAKRDTLAMCCRGFDAEEVLKCWVTSRQERAQQLFAERQLAETEWQFPDPTVDEATLDEEQMDQTERSDTPNESDEDALGFTNFVAVPESTKLQHGLGTILAFDSDDEDVSSCGGFPVLCSPCSPLLVSEDGHEVEWVPLRIIVETLFAGVSWLHVEVGAENHDNRQEWMKTENFQTTAKTSFDHKMVLSDFRKRVVPQ
jgi:hypothetical protein